MTDTNQENINKRKGETRYPAEKIITRTVGIAPSHDAHINQVCARLNYRKPGSNWNRSKYIQKLIDDDMKKAR